MKRERRCEQLRTTCGTYSFEIESYTKKQSDVFITILNVQLTIAEVNGRTLVSECSIMILIYILRLWF